MILNGLAKMHKALDSAEPLRFFRFIPTTDGVNQQTGIYGMWINEIDLYTGANATGTVYPQTNLTSNTSDSECLISAGYNYTTNYPYKSFNNNAVDGWWSLGGSPPNKWLQIEFYTAVDFKSIKVDVNTGSNTLKLFVLGSPTGEFTGEETYLGYKNDTNALWTLNL